MNDLFFGAPVKETFSSVAKGMGSIFGKAWNSMPTMPKAFKGVSAGGEEFTVKLDKALNGAKRPFFLHGIFKDLVSAQDDLPILLYLSEDDDVSQLFESRVLTREDII